jgi:predicted anti-sigma-YlaC factor YlaD
MSAALFLFGFLAAGIFGAKALASFEIEPAERIGAEAFLFLLCVGASAISILSYLQGSRRFHRHPGRIAGLVGGVAAAGTFSAAAGTIYLGAGFAFSVALALVLPGLAAFVWPLLTAKARKD